MTRTEARAAAMKLVYEWEMGGEGGEDTLLGLLEIQPGEEETDYMDALVKGVQTRKNELDALIATHAKNWRLERIERVNLCILRVGAYELLENIIPADVVINEAIELTKIYSAPETKDFVNGVLASIMRERDAKA